MTHDVEILDREGLHAYRTITITSAADASLREVSMLDFFKVAGTRPFGAGRRPALLGFVVDT
jgi:hypothetical protein